MMLYFLFLLFSWDYLPINSIHPKAEVNNSWTYIQSSICLRSRSRDVIMVGRMFQRKWHGVAYKLKRKMHRNSLDNTVSQICFAWLIIHHYRMLERT